MENRPHTTDSDGALEEANQRKLSLIVPADTASPASHASPTGTSEVSFKDLPLRPHTTGRQLEETDQDNATKTLDFKQPTIEDLGRSIRERNQVHAWIDSEIKGDTLQGLPAAFENLKDRINTWDAIRKLTDFKLSHEYEIHQPVLRKEIMRRVKPLHAMGSPLSSNRPSTAAPQTGTEPRLLGGVVDITVPDFPPVGKRGAVSAEEAGVAASYPFRLCGDQWSLDLSCNKHWIKIHLCYKGCKAKVDRISSVWFRRDEPGEKQLQYVFDPMQRSFMPGQPFTCCWSAKTLQVNFPQGRAKFRVQILEGGNC